MKLLRTAVRAALPAVLTTAACVLALAAPAQERELPPPRMPWQRTLEDALAISRSTGKPLLVCVNVDGEPASEALARGRYRDSEFAALADGFVPVIASPDVHDPLDHTSRGERIPDPRFGRVIDAEHVAIEPLAFERWFDDRRVAPRHVAVSPEGEVLFDLYLLQDLTVIDDALRENGVFDASAPKPISERTEEELFASPDHEHRAHLEANFLAAEPAERARLAGLALDPERATQHPQLVRLALHDPEAAVRRAALTALYRHPAGASADHFALALRVAHAEPSAQGDALVPALELFASRKQGANGVRAQRMLRGVRALEAGSDVVDVEAWLLATAGRIEIDETTVDDWDERLGRIEERLAEDPDDPDWNLLLARNGRARAKAMIAEGSDPSLLLEDVRRAADKVLDARPDDALAGALLAWSAYMLLDFDAAADAARDAAPELAPWSALPVAVDALDALADGRTRAIYAAMEAEEPWPAEWLADAVAAHEVLLAHPLGTEAQALRGFRLLGSVELLGPQADAVRRGLERWSASTTMHEWWRWIVRRDAGPDGLLAAYDGLTLDGLGKAQRLSFAGLAKLVAAERRIVESDPTRALEDYRLAALELESAVAESSKVREFARWYQAQARAGRARLFLEAGRLDEALAEALLCFAIETEAHDAPDARGRTPRETLQRVRDALLARGRVDDADALERWTEAEPASEASAGDAEGAGEDS